MVMTPGAPQPLEERAVGDGVEARLGPRADVSGQLVARPVGVDEVDRRVVMRRESSSAESTRGHQVAHVDDVGQLGAQHLDAPRQLELLLEHPAADRALDPGAQRIEQDDDRRRREQRVEEEQPLLLGRDPVDQHAVDQRQDEDQRAQHHHPAEQLVEVEQPVANQGLRQEVQVDDDEDVAEGRAVGHAPPAAPR